MAQPKPIRARPAFWLAAAVLVAAIAGGGYGIWYLFLQPSGPPPVSISNVPLPSASAGSGASASAGPGVSASSGPGVSASGASASAGSGASASFSGSASSPSTGSPAGGGTASLDGTWTVDVSLGSFSDFTDSFVGYRVQEQLASIGANTAVGRTPKVAGSISVAGTRVTAGTFTADLTSLQSNDDRRDGQLRRQGIQTAQFPTATFTLTQPIDLGALPTAGQSVQASATGDFTLHGVTKSVQIQVTAKRSSNVIAVTGSLPIAFADYGIERPNSFAVLSIDDNGTMEFQLLFTKG